MEAIFLAVTRIRNVNKPLVYFVNGMVVYDNYYSNEAYNVPTKVSIGVFALAVSFMGCIVTDCIRNYLAVLVALRSKVVVVDSVGNGFLSKETFVYFGVAVVKVVSFVVSYYDVYLLDFIGNFGCIVNTKENLIEGGVGIVVGGTSFCIAISNYIGV